MDDDSWSVVKTFLVDYRNSHRLAYDSVVKHLDYVFQEYYVYSRYDKEYMIKNFMLDYSQGNLTTLELLEAILDYQDYSEMIDPGEVLDLINSY